MKNKLLLAFLLCLTAGMLRPAAAQSQRFTLPALPYALDALEPRMSRETLEYHYGKHFKTYIDNLNRLAADAPYDTMTLEEIVATAPEGPLFNNAGQVLNHGIFFLGMSPDPQSAPAGALAEAIDRAFGSFEGFKEAFAKVATDLFGSGWAWLAANAQGDVVILSEPNGSNPVRQGFTPLVGLDVWEHSYYLDYRNDRKKYIDTYWELIDWRRAEERYRNR